MPGKTIGCALICACLYFASLVLSEEKDQYVSVLERNADLSFANMVKDLFHYLNATKVGSSLVAQLSDCAFACLRVVTCFSFNIAAYPDIDGNLWCELLATDKYNASDKFHANPHFHHYGIDVSSCFLIINFVRFNLLAYSDVQCKVGWFHLSIVYGLILLLRQCKYLSLTRKCASVKCGIRAKTHEDFCF